MNNDYYAQFEARRKQMIESIKLTQRENENEDRRKRFFLRSLIAKKKDEAEEKHKQMIETSAIYRTRYLQKHL